MKAAGSSVKPYRNQPAGIVGRKPPVDASCCPRFPPSGCQVPQTSKSAASHPALKKLLLEVIALQPVPQPGQSAVALAEAEGLPESSRGSSASEPPGSRPETDCTPGRGARATQPETIHLRRSFFLNQHPQGVPALRIFSGEFQGGWPRRPPGTAARRAPVPAPRPCRWDRR